MFFLGYYEGNGIYDYLDRCENQKNFYRTGRTLWLLAYGNRDLEPVILTVASANPLDVPPTPAERAAVHASGQIADGSGLPVSFIRFDPGRPLRQAGYWERGMREIPVVSAAFLKDRFHRLGLEMNEMTAHKEINDKSSGAYHEWQRAHMGDAVTVADIDLLWYADKKPAEIIELKRSYIELEQWQPYRQDYKNFILLSKLAGRCGLRFYIVYNRRTKTPFYDDISRLKIFRFDHRCDPCCQFLGYCLIGEFVQGQRDGNRDG